MSATLDAPRDVAAIHPLRFWVEYDDKGGAHDWAEWTKRGATIPTTTAEKMDRVKRDPAIWATLRPFYEAWKAGNSAPVNGIPLDSVPFMTRELVEALARHHIRSIEDLDALEDAQIPRLNIPGLRGLQQKARVFRQARETTAPVMEEVAKLRAELEALRAERDEAAATAQQFAAEAGRRRRTRDEVMPQPEG